MRVTRVSARAFGWLHDQTLDLAEGLTVVYGPNEAGKSTWHAALLAALCGRWPARGRGEPGIERYRPWSGDAWEVGAALLLDDGRRIDLRQDLEARHGWATDAALGRDVAAEITGPKGVPDGSRWLGLERAAFVATACVRQSQVMFAAGEVDGLRTYVEGAAATATAEGTSADETAAAALARIDAFRRSAVGSERATRAPLPEAQRVLAEAHEALRIARSRRDELDRRTATAAQLRAAAGETRRRLARHEAALATAEADRLQQRASEAARLAAGPPLPPSPPEEVAVRRAVPDHAVVADPPEPVVDPQRRSLLLGVAAALVAAGIIVSVMGWSAVGVILALAGVGLGVAGVIARRQAAPVPAPAEPGAVAALQALLTQEREQQSARDEAIARRERLRALLDGGTLQDLTDAARRARRRAEALASEVPDRAGPAPSPVDSDADVDELRRVSQETEHAAALADKDVAQAEAELSLQPVAEAEEAFAAAEAEVARLTSLDDVLARTRHYLARAQERVHREIAPTLAAAVSDDLATVTAGRYVEAVVDPRSLDVRLRGAGTAPLRAVDQLSVGTREQVYLLLRVALAERIVAPGTSLPLLFDDVTVHADADRTARLLDLLLTVADRHQVVLFTQQAQVRAWAAGLTDPRNALVELGALAPV